MSLRIVKADFVIDRSHRRGIDVRLKAALWCFGAGVVIGLVTLGAW